MARDQKVKNKAAKQPVTDATQAPVESAAAPADPNTAAPAEANTATPASPVQVAEQHNNGNSVSTVAPSWPSWPTSRPGPRATPPLPGMRSFNPFRPEQVSEVGYNQETGESASSEHPSRSLPDASMADLASFDQKPPTGQDLLGKRKKRL